MKMTIRLDSANFQRDLERGLDRLEVTLPVALTTTAKKVFADSQNLVPVDTGALKASGKVKPPKMEAVTNVAMGTGGVTVAGGRATVVEIEYGGPDVPYAVIVHEDLQMRHAPGKTAKFLSRPANLAIGLLNRLAREALQKAFR